MRRAFALAAVAAALVAGDACSSSSPGPSARTCTIAPPAPSDGRLHAQGTTLRDALGRVVLLRGVNAGGRSKLAPFAPFDFADGDYDGALARYLDRAASWGIDVLRVPFVWAAVEPSPGMDDEAFLQRYDKLLDAAWARGMWTVVDFHQDIYAEILCGDGFPDWTIPDPKPTPRHDCAQWQLEYFGDPDVQAAFDRFWADGSQVQVAFASMWDRMIARHKDRPGVVGFEVINEPGWGSQMADAFESGTLTAFYSRMVPRMRAAAPSSLVFVDPPGLDSATVTTSLGRPTGDGIVFAPHFYPIGAANPDGVLDRMKPWSDLGAAWNVPVFLGEFGTGNKLETTPEYMRAHFDALDAYGMSGTEWEYSVAKDLWNEESFSLVDEGGNELPVASAVMRPFARAVAGESVVSSFDAASKTFSSTYAPSDSGVSEFSVPARAYPNGFDVALDGACMDKTSTPGKLLVKSDPGASSVTLRVTSR